MWGANGRRGGVMGEHKHNPTATAAKNGERKDEADAKG